MNLDKLIKMLLYLPQHMLDNSKRNRVNLNLPSFRALPVTYVAVPSLEVL